VSLDTQVEAVEAEAPLKTTLSTMHTAKLGSGRGISAVYYNIRTKQPFILT